MRLHRTAFLGWVLVALGAAAAAAGPIGGLVDRAAEAAPSYDAQIGNNARDMMTEGRSTFRFDTFGSERFFGDTIGLHKALEGASFGGVGPGVSPKTALA